MTFRNCVAVDLGASSGRVMLARYERECRSLPLREIHRFNNVSQAENLMQVYQQARLSNPELRKSAADRDAAFEKIIISGRCNKICDDNPAGNLTLCRLSLFTVCACGSLP